MAFATTTQKCNACDKTVYLVDKLTADNRVYHKACFRWPPLQGDPQGIHFYGAVRSKLVLARACFRTGSHACEEAFCICFVNILSRHFQLSNFNSFEGVLYCRPHFDQLFKRTGSLAKSFGGMPNTVKPERTADNMIPPTKNVSNLFGGTKDKCTDCNKTVYPIEKVTVNGTAYHRSCFKCTYGGCTISPSSYIVHEGKLYCKHHHIQLFKEKGNYSQLENEKTLEVAKAIIPMEVVADS